ncbi:MAG: hypothetical protein IPL78_21330 [Chloroflexi bacterium]|nr:hypothetical protein [Chloroflexota bacterium]
MPKFFLGPIDLWWSALTAFGYGDGTPTSYTPLAQGRNVEDPRPVPLAVPHWTDTNNWAYIADPAIFPSSISATARNPGACPTLCLNCSSKLVVSWPDPCLAMMLCPSKYGTGSLSA